jgi:hypothetical protein
METIRYSLDNKESSGFVRLLQIIFGVACIAVSLWWAWFIIKSSDNDSYWLATLFMLFFGTFQIYSGLGYAAKFIVLHNNSIEFKKAAIGIKEQVEASRIEKIEILPLSVKILMKDKRSFVISFGMSIASTIDSIKDKLIEWSGRNNVEIVEKTDRA